MSKFILILLNNVLIQFQNCVYEHYTNQLKLSIVKERYLSSSY